MKTLLTWTAAVVAGVVLATASGDADAKKRFGGGKNTGTQREAVQPGKPASPAATPAPAQGAAAAPAAAGAAPAAAGAGAAAAGRSMPGWLGPVAGLLAGGALAALFFGGAFDGLTAGDFMAMALLALGVFLVLRLMRSRAQPQAAYRTSTGDTAQGPVPGLVGGARMPVAPAVAEGRIPADFDVQGFVRNAKTSFIRLQAANDRRDLDDIRDYTTPQMYAEIAMQMQDRGDAAQRTEVVSIDAQVLQVVTEDDRMIASVRFTGLIREDDAANPEPVDEVWHVERKLSGRNAAWLIAGIQQVEDAA
ncbi:MAG: Tim44 domain-containing protein [Pseudomonadota bacterium]|jgi:predicted lipid-binding transport protein (Tim44 family)